MPRRSAARAALNSVCRYRFALAVEARAGDIAKLMGLLQRSDTRFSRFAHKIAPKDEDRLGGFHASIFLHHPMVGRGS